MATLVAIPVFYVVINGDKADSGSRENMRELEMSIAGIEKNMAQLSKRIQVLTTTVAEIENRFEQLNNKNKSFGTVEYFDAFTAAKDAPVDSFSFPSELIAQAPPVIDLFKKALSERSFNGFDEPREQNLLLKRAYDEHASGGDSKQINLSKHIASVLSSTEFTGAAFESVDCRGNVCRIEMHNENHGVSPPNEVLDLEVILALSEASGGQFSLQQQEIGDSSIIYIKEE